MSPTPDNTTGSAEVPRKVLHLLVAVLPLAALHLDRMTLLAVCGPLAALAVLADVWRARSDRFEKFIRRWFGFMMRDTEIPTGGRTVVNGATWVLLSFVLLLILFPIRVAAEALFVSLIADAFAALVGRRFGRHAWPWNRRTIEGTAAFIITGIVAALVFPGMQAQASIPAVLVGAAAEVLPGPFNDNLRVPFAIACTLFLVEALA